MQSDSANKVLFYYYTESLLELRKGNYCKFNLRIQNLFFVEQKIFETCNNFVSDDLHHRACRFT